MIAFIATRHAHDGARSIAGQHILTDPHRNLFSVERIDCIRTNESACDLLHLGHAVYFGAALYIL